MAQTVNLDFLEPASAVELSRKTLAQFELESDESLAAYMPSQEVDDIEYAIDLLDATDQVVVANWRAFGGATTSEVWGKGGSARGEFMPLARNYVVDEKQRLRQRADAKNAISREASDFIVRGTQAVAKEINVQRGKALAYGRLELQGSGNLREIVDFGRKPEFTAVAALLFTDPTADPIEIISTYVDMYEIENGFRPTEMLMSSKVKRTIYSHPKVVLTATANPDKVRATNAEVDYLFDQFDLPPIKTISASQYRKDNLETATVEQHYLLPQDSIIFTAGSGDAADPLSSPYGRTFWGPTVSGELPEFGLTSGGLDVPGIVAAVYDNGWPFNREVIIDALAMPVVFKPNYTLTLKVV
ncbi:MAG: major capsid protein [Alphaproteobacteria bacterium]|nr:major capsid protein [Alphaproteobacteria bacterium]